MNNNTLTVVVALVGLYLLMQQQKPAAPVQVAAVTPTRTDPTPKEIAEDVIDVLGKLYDAFDNA